MPRYLRFIAAGRYAEALAVIRESIPFPAVCGYVCPAPCELKCQLAVAADAPEAIRTLKRFAADQAAQAPPPDVATPPATGKSVAIVGAGPAGLTAAYYLARAGHTPTVFEALPEAGGMMRVGIPAYRLPRNVLDSDIATICTAGVEIRTGVRIESADALLVEGYSAVFVALGAHRGAKTGIAGEQSPGVVDALSFLAEVNAGKDPRVAETVAVIGGGNSAVDAARTCLRLGAKEVTILYRRSREEMRAYPSEVEEALREGVRLELLAVPQRIVAADGGLRVECLRAAAGRKDAAGLPVIVAESEFSAEARMVIAAVGQEPAIPAGFGLPLAGRTIRVGSDGTTTGKAGVFAGADCVTGPGSVIEAIAGGRRAAMAIDRYLGGTGAIAERLAPAEAPLPPAGTAPRGDLPAPHGRPERRPASARGRAVRRVRHGGAGACARDGRRRGQAVPALRPPDHRRGGQMPQLLRLPAGMLAAIRGGLRRSQGGPADRPGRHAGRRDADRHHLRGEVRQLRALRPVLPLRRPLAGVCGHGGVTAEER